MIPKIIHYIWIGDKPIPTEYQKFINDWPNKLSGFEIKLWNQDTYKLGLNKFAEEAAYYGKWAFVSDYMRFRILYEYGGIYLDIDEKVIKSLDTFLNDSIIIGQEPGNRLQAGVLGAEAGHYILKAILEHYDKLSFDPNNTSKYIIGDQIYTVLRSIFPSLILSDSIEHIGDGVVIYPSRFFCPDLATLNNYDETYTVHLPNASWLGWSNRTKVRIYKYAMNFKLVRLLYTKLFR